MTPARLNAVSTPIGYRCRNQEVYAVLDRYLKSERYSIDACIEAALVSLGAGKVLSALSCPKCSARHLDMYAKALEPHAVHTCNACAHEWRHPGQLVQSNPLAEFGLLVQDGELYCTSLPPADAAG